MDASQPRLPDLQADLRDCQIYLQRIFPEIKRIPLSADRHYGSRDNEIAYVVIHLPEQALRRRVRAQAEAALKHLGYKIEPRSSADVYDVWPDGSVPSAHEIVRALARFADLVRVRRTS
jgi:hypothetical protein